MALFAEVDDDPLSNDSYDPFANSLPSKKKKDTKNEGDTSSSLFANGGDDEDDDVFALKNNKEKVSSKSLFDEDSDGALGSISKQSKSKEENSGRSDDLGEFDFSKLDKLGTEKNKTKKKNSKKKKEFVDTGPAQRGGARSGALGIGHGLDEFDLSLKKKKLGSTHGIDKTGEDKKSIKKDDDIEVGLFDDGSRRYFYFCINDYQNNVNETNSICLANNLSNKHILTKICIQDTKNFMKSPVGAKRNYNGPIDLKQINVQLLDEFGEIINLNHMDIGFTLQLELLYERDLIVSIRGLRALYRIDKIFD